MEQDLSILNAGLYGTWDREINPNYVVNQLFKAPVSRHVDMRAYKGEVTALLDKSGTIIERNSSRRYLEDWSKEERDAFLERKKAGLEVDSEMADLFYDSDKNTSLYLYKRSVIQVTYLVNGDCNLSWFYPAAENPDTEDFKDFVLPEKKEQAKVSVLVQRSQGIALQKIPFDPPKFINDDIEMNYGTGFKKKYDTLVERLTTFNKGVFIIRGTPGSGKTSLVKSLVKQVDRPFIFIPIGLAASLSDPSFLTLLLSQGRNAVLVLEDAEQAIQSREEQLSTAHVTSNLLQLSDGIISTLLGGISIILTFNTSKENIDSALMRKGRLALDLVVDALPVKDAQRLVDFMGKNYKVQTPMALCDIYNLEVDTGYIEPVKKSMGFGG